MKVYLAGCGQLGSRLGQQLSSDGHDVVGLKRPPIDSTFPMLAINLQDSHAVNQLPHDADIIVFTVTPSEYSDSGYQQVYKHILGNVIDYAKQHQKPPLFLLVSSTGVYGQHKGEWVDENSLTEPTQFNGAWVIYGERLIRQQLDNTLTVRFSGIYGANRTRMIKTATSGNPIQQSPPLWTNRIHEDDCIGALSFLIKQYSEGKTLKDIYLVSDHSPVSSWDVAAYICELQGMSMPPTKTTDLSHKLNKRCMNQRIVDLGYTFKYPDYRAGYKAIIEANK